MTLCSAFRDIGGRTFRCVLEQGLHQHVGIAGQQRMTWLDGALGANGQIVWPKSSDPIGFPVAPLVVEPTITVKDPNIGPTQTPPVGIGPARQPYPHTILAVPNDLTPAENADVPLANRDGVNHIQKPYVVLPTHEDGPGYGQGEMPDLPPSVKSAPTQPGGTGYVDSYGDGY